MVAQVIPLRRTRPVAAVVAAWRLEEAQAELAMRRSEEQEQAAAVGPLLRRMEILTFEAGPVAHQLVAALAYWHQRHARRWADEDEGSVA